MSGDAGGAGDSGVGSEADDHTAGGSDGAAVGTGVARREDDRLLRGVARFVDDDRPPDAAVLAFARSDRAHARLTEVDVAAAERVDGVAAAYTWDDVAASDAPGRVEVVSESLDVAVPGHPVLADDRVRYHGQPVAAVVAEDRYAARDGVAAVAVDYDPLPAVTDPVAATDEDAPTLFETAPDNVVLTVDRGDEAATDRAMREADHVVDLDLTNNRLAPVPLEPRATLARPGSAGDGGTGGDGGGTDARSGGGRGGDRGDGDPGDRDRLRVDMSVQNPHAQRDHVASALGLDPGDVRVVVPSVGGGFGQKDTLYPEPAATAWAARRLDRPVAWTATRRESMLAGNHGRDNRARARLAVDDDGTIRGMEVRTHSALGGYDLGSAAVVLAEAYTRSLPGQYDLPAVHARTEVALTNTAPVHTYRGGVVPEAMHVVERLVGAAARELDLDPAAIRRQNLVPGDAFPHENSLGGTYDSGDYHSTLQTAVETLSEGPVPGGAPFDRTDRTGRPDRDATPDRDPGSTGEGETGDGRERGDEEGEDRLVGVGLGSYVELIPPAFESGRVELRADGSVVAVAGSLSHGQGHETTYAQVVADELGVSPDAVAVVEGDTDRIETGNGTWGSRSTVAAGNALRECARSVAGDLRRAAADRFDCPPEAVAVADGRVRAPDGEWSLATAAAAASDHRDPGSGAETEPDPDRDAGTDTDPDPDPDARSSAVALQAATEYEPDGSSFTFGTHAAVVAVDPGTGDYEVKRYVAVDDCGVRVNPTIVEGQIQGSVAQGVGQATTEAVAYEDGRLATDSLLSYGVPRATQVPEAETREHVTPARTNEMGVKGIGEVGTVAAPPAVVNAVHDALAPAGVGADDPALSMPLRPAAIRAAIRGDGATGGSRDDGDADDGDR